MSRSDMLPIEDEAAAGCAEVARAGSAGFAGGVPCLPCAMSMPGIEPMSISGIAVDADDAGTCWANAGTVSVQPAQQISYMVSADALGRWAYHCHMLYHMEAGMFREVIVA